MNNSDKLEKPGLADRFILEKFVPVIFVFSIGLIILVGILSYIGVKEFQTSKSLVTHTYDVKENIFNIYYELANVKELERFATEKGMRTSENISFAKNKLNAYQGSVEVKLISLKKIVQDNQTQLLRINSIDSLIQYRLNYAKILLDEASKPTPNESKINQWVIESSNLRSKMISIREEMLKDEDNFLEIRVSELDDKVNKTEGFIIVSTLIGFIIMIYSVYITRRLFNSRNEALDLLKQSYKNLETKVADRTKDLLISRNRFNTIYDSSIAGVFIIGKDLIIREANSAFLSMIGYTHKDLPINWHNINTHDFEEQDNYAREALREKGSIEPYHKNLFKKDGSKVDILIGNASLTEENGNSLIFTLNITENINIQKALQEREKQLTLITDAIPALISYVDKDEVYRFNNVVYEKWFRKKKESVIGLKIKDLIKENYPNFKPSIDRVMSGETLTYETNLETVDGKKIVQGNMIPNLNENGEVIGFYSMTMDITDLKKHEQALEEREERFRVLAENSSVLIWMSDKDKTHNYFNKTWLDYTGIALEDALNEGWEKCIYPADLASFNTKYDEAFIQKEPFEIEYRLKNANGSYCWVYNKGIPRYEGDTFVGFIGSGFNIHDRKKAHSYLDIQYNISRMLSESDSLNEAYEKVLKTIVEGVEWDAGVIWIYDKNGKQLRIQGIYSKEKDLIKEIKRTVSVENSILSGNVYTSKNPIWVEDLSKYSNTEFEKKSDIEFSSAFAFPIISNNKVIAIIECFSLDQVAPINDLLEMLYSTGRQIGTFIEKKNAEVLLRKANDELEEKVLIRTNDLNKTIAQLKNEIEHRLKAEKEVEVLAHTIKSSNDLIWITDLDNNIIFINKAFQETYGYSKKELVGQKISVIRDETHGKGLSEEISRESRKGGWTGELLNVRKDGSVFPVRVSTSLVRDTENKPRAIVGIAVDITELRRKEETIEVQNAKLKLMQEITVVANKTFNINEALGFAIDKICEVLDWDIGHAYLIDKDNLLRSTKIWNKNISEKFKEFKFVSENTFFSINEGIPGHVRYTGRSIWIEDLQQNQISVRKKYFEELGIKSGLAFLILIEDEVAGILEFYSTAKRSLNPEYLESVENIGTQLGRVLERKIALENIVTSESKFRAVSETALDGILILDKNEKIYFVNESILKNFGYTRKELIGEPITKLLNLKKFKNNNQIAEARSKNLPLEVTGCHKNDIEFPLEISSSVWFDKKEKYTTFIIRNIIERKRTEEIVKTSETLLKEAQRMAHLGSWTWDIESDERHFSDELKRIYGFEPEDDVSAGDITKRILESDLKDTMRYLKEAVEQKKKHNYLQRVLMPSGEMKILSCKGDVMLGKNGEVKRIFGTVQDITDISIKEQELVLSNKKLKETQNELVHNEKLAVLGRFSSGIAHEIRNPLANISALSQLLLKAPLDEKMKKHLRYIMINTDIANKIIKDLLNYASPDVNEFCSINMNELFEKMKNMVKPRCDKYNVKLICNFQEKLPAMYIEEKKMESAFFNFISNAIEAMEDGGKLEFDASFDRSNNELVVNFIDTGIGISQKNIDKIFEPFFTTKDTGTGLGMALASQTIKIHNGRLNIRSVPGEGTNIEVRLPVKNN